MLTILAFVLFMLHLEVLVGAEFCEICSHCCLHIKNVPNFLLFTVPSIKTNQRIAYMQIRTCTGCTSSQVIKLNTNQHYIQILCAVSLQVEINDHYTVQCRCIQ